MIAARYKEDGGFNTDQAGVKVSTGFSMTGAQWNVVKQFQLASSFFSRVAGNYDRWEAKYKRGRDASIDILAAHDRDVSMAKATDELLTEENKYHGLA